MSDSDGKRLDKEQTMRLFLLRTGKVNKTTTGKKTRQIWLQSVAVVAVLMMITYFLFQPGNHQANEQLADITVETPAGSPEEIYLPDGTQVWLNAASRLTYTQDFDVTERKVYLSGEGYFEVTRNEKLPFIVKTDELQVSVLGTKFNLKNYADDGEATIYLLEGKVVIGNHVRQSEDIIMEPEQKVFFDKKTGNTRLTQVTAGNSVEWTTGVLFFDEDLLPDIAKSLERSYDVKITVHPDLANVRLYGSFSRKEQTVKDILDILFSTGKIKYSITGNEIVLYPL